MCVVVFVEGKSDVGLIKPELLNNKNTIISLDYNSHKLLNQSNINHKLIEDYFNNDDKLIIDDLAFKLGISWYTEENISEYLEYEGFNLGTLLDLEIPSYFFTNLKRIIGIKRAIENENPNEIISYSLKNYVDNICKNRKIKSSGEIKNEARTGLFYNDLEIPINVGFKTIKLKISRKNYFRLKKNLDYIINLMLNVKPNIESLINDESILLIDFHTIMYKDLLMEFQKFPKNVIIFNQRKPAVWNLESFKIIRNLKSKVLTLEYFENHEIQKIILQEQKKLKNNLDNLWKNEQCLEKIFSFEGETFWNIIKFEFSNIITERLIESVRRIILLKKMFETIKVFSILDWAHTGMEEKIITHIVKNKKIQIYCLQHGVMTLNNSMHKYLPIIPILPSNNTKMFVWGNTLANFSRQHAIKKDDVIIVGSPRHDKFFNQKNKITNNGSVLITSNMFFHYNFNGNDSRAFETLELALIKILKILKSYPNRKPIIKLHPAESFDVKSIIRKIDPDIPIYQHEDILPLLQSCDSMISLNYSTVLLDALILNKPSMVIITEKQNFEEEELIQNKAAFCVSDLENLERSLKQFLFDENFRNDLITRGNEFTNNYLSNQGTASKSLVKKLMENN